MASQKKRQLSETSEDLDDPAPVPEDSSWPNHFSDDSSLRRPQDHLPEGPVFMSDDEDTDDEEEQLDLPDMNSSPVPRSRGFSSLSEASDCPAPAPISQRGHSSFSDESNDLPPKIISRGQKKGSEGVQFSYPGQIKSRRLTGPMEDAIIPPTVAAAARNRTLSSLSTNSTSADSADTDDDGSPAGSRQQSTAMRIMAAMGHQRGRGLGKNEQGRVEPVEASNQKGRRGLGFSIPALGTPGLKYDPSLEEINEKEPVEWLISPEYDPPDEQDLRQWMIIGPRKLTIDDESTFCDKVVLNNVLKSKSVFDALDGKELMKARSRANPFEQIRGVFFLNRAAMKMANMDAILGFMFTKPRDEQDADLLGPNDLLYFADVCAGPGGFTEYVLWRRKWKAKGIGFTLKGANDFRLDDFYAAPSETFEPYYGSKEDGDVYSPDNINSLHCRVTETTDGQGVHFMMADGGFSVEGQENIQEVLSKRLYLCQCLVALRIVRPGGHFVVKLFDIFTPFSVGLVYLMYRCFAKVTILKPNTSRPANSERYLICAHKRDNCETVANYLMRVNKQLEKLEKTGEDVNSIVPLEIMTETDKNFFEAILFSNNSLGQRQVVQLLKIAAFAENPQMMEQRQIILRRKCLDLYQVPDRTRSAPKEMPPATMACELLGKLPDRVALPPITQEISQSLKGEPRDWMCCAIGSTKDDDLPQPTFFVGLGGARVFRLVSRERWIQVSGLILPRKTLLVGELIPELEGGRGNQKRINILHIIDAAFLGGDDLRRVSLEDRLEQCETFAKAVKGNCIRAKKMYDLYQISELCGSVECRESKKGDPCLGLPAIPSDTRKFFIPGGVMFLSRTREPWVRAFSKREKMEYFYNTLKKSSEFAFPDGARSIFDWTFKNFKVWWWEEGVKIRPDQSSTPDPNKVQPKSVLDYVQCKIDVEKQHR